METQENNQPLTLTVGSDKIQLFSTLLQSGIEIETTRGDVIGTFLERLPGFSEDYIVETVQTIFLNGTATDDLQTPLSGDSPVLAISAAMPGLAGAIFRKNSLHASLRTAQTVEEDGDTAGTTTVTLKLFNAIARDKGTMLLAGGVNIKASNITDFLGHRSTLIPHIESATVAEQPIQPSELTKTLSGLDTVHLQIIES